MSQGRVPRPFDLRAQRWSCPGKVFLIGEYLPLWGGTAVVAAIGPRFTLSHSKEPNCEPSWSNESPAGLFEQKLFSSGKPQPRWLFFDPHAGRGGFGASTAQFLLRFSAEFGFASKTVNEAWTSYRELLSGARPGGKLPSGADLYVQWQGGAGELRFGNGLPEWRDLTTSLERFHFVVFSAAGKPDRKVVTHSHLSKLSEDSLSEVSRQRLESLSRRFLDAAVQGDSVHAGEAMSGFAQTLNQIGLEAPGALEDREILAAVEGVAGVKGVGALLSDGLVVLLSSNDPVRNSSVLRELLKVAGARGLELVSERWVPEAGVRRDV